MKKSHRISSLLEPRNLPASCTRLIALAMSALFVLVLTSPLSADEAEESAARSRARSSLQAFTGLIEQSPIVKDTWTEFLNVEELTEFLTNDDYEVLEGDFKDDLENLSRVERELDSQRAREVITTLQAWKSAIESAADATPPAAPAITLQSPKLESMDDDTSDDEDSDDDKEEDGNDEDLSADALAADEADAAVESLKELRSWISANRLRTWQGLLKLEDAADEIEAFASDDDDEKESADSDEEDDRFAETNRVLAILSAEQGSLPRARRNLRRELTDFNDVLEFEVSDTLAGSARELKRSYRPISPARVAQLRQEARDAVRRLDEFLYTGPADRQSGWSTYLKLPELTNELNRGDWPAQRTLVKSYQQLDSGHPGLEKHRFEEARQALQDYLQVLTLATPPQSLESKQQELASAVNALGNALAAAGKTKEEEWKDYLDWELLDEVAKDSSPNMRDLGRLISLFEADERGLEMSYFQRVLHALVTYAERSQQVRGPQTVDRYRGQLERLARSLEDHADFPTASTSAQLTDRMQWLRASGYGTDLADRVKSAFRRPNINVTMNGEFFVQQIADTQNESMPVNRCFEGAHVTGCARSNASFRGQLVPQENGIAIDILVNSRTVATTTARQRKVSVFAEGVTNTSGTKRIYFTLNGITSSPATANAYTNQAICGANVDRCVGKRLIGRFAQRKARKTVPKAERMANDEASDTVASRLDKETGEMLAKANSQFNEQMSKLRASGFYPDAINLKSTATQILLDAMFASGDYLGAATDPPKIKMTGVVMAQIHESVANNVLAKTFGGRQIDNEWLVDFMQTNGLEVPDDLLAPSERKNKPKKIRSDIAKEKAEAEEAAESDDDADDGQKEGGDGSELDETKEEGPEEWSMTFDRNFPIIVRFNDEGVSIAIRGREFSNADQEITDLIEMSAQYRIKATPDGHLVAKRIGDVDVLFVNSPGRLDGRQLTYKTFLLRKMDPLFREQISTADDLPDMGQMTELLDAVKLESIESGRGWLSTNIDIDPSVLKSLMPTE